MLELLEKYARDHGLRPEPGFNSKDVRWAVVCDAKGRFSEVVELGDTSKKKNPGRAFSKCPDLSQPEMKWRGITKSHFLVETAEVVALLIKDSDIRKMLVDERLIRKMLDERHVNLLLHANEGGDEEIGAVLKKYPNIKRIFAQNLVNLLLHTDEVVEKDVNTLLTKHPYVKKIADKHHYFVDLLRQASGTMPELADLAVQLATPETVNSISERLKVHKARPTEKVTFKVGDRFPVESSLWHEWWRNFRKELVPDKPTKKADKRKSESAQPMRCFVSGDLIQPAKTHRTKIKGLRGVGGLSMGDVLIGYKQESFRSYGLKQSANAAMSENMASVYCTALNDLIKRHGQLLVAAKVVHWFMMKDIPSDDDPLDWLVEGDQQQERNAQQRAKELLKSIRTGKRVDLANNYFFALTMSGAGGRVMVRDWMEGQFEELARNVCAWFEDLGIVNYSGSKVANSPKIERIITCLLQPPKQNQKYEDWIKPIGADRISLWRAAACGETIPYSVLARVVVLDARFRVSGTLEEVLQSENKGDFPSVVSLLHARMGLMKAYHIRKSRKKGGDLMSQDLKAYLNKTHPHPAYHCGRLMAVLARLQRSALGDVGAGVVQRYYAAASSTPALVLGRLTRNSQSHLNKLEPGLTHWYEDKIAGIWGRIKDSLPQTLTLEEQSLFALGYYQQMADMRTKTLGNSNQEKEENNE